MDEQSNNQNPGNLDERDQNVYSFMLQLVQEKHGDEVDFEFLESESNRLYDVFGDSLLNYFEPQLTEEQKKQFDQLIENNENQDILMNYLIENIKDIEQQIIQVLVAFRTDYVSGRFEQLGEETSKNDDSANGDGSDDSDNSVN